MTRTEAKLPSPLEVEGTPVTEVVSAITWEALRRRPEPVDLRGRTSADRADSSV